MNPNSGSLPLMQQPLSITPVSQGHRISRKKLLKFAGMVFAATLSSISIYFSYYQYKKYQNEPIKDTKSGDIISLSSNQWNEFWKNGYVKIGKVATDNEIIQMKDRLKDIMMGKIKYDDQLIMQLDPGGDVDDYFKKNLMNDQTVGFKGATPNYRKIGEAGHGLECDDIFKSFMSKTIFQNICKKVYGNHVDIGVYRAMVFNKPASGGTELPWHQDGGNWWALDRDPLIFVWTALYPSLKSSGCVQVIKGSHKLGILTKTGHMLTEQLIQLHCDESKLVNLEAQPGESYLVHNWTIHRSGRNNTSTPRWALSVNYIDGRTKVLDPKPKDAGPLGEPGQTFTTLFNSDIN